MWVLSSMYHQNLILSEHSCHTGCIDIFSLVCVHRKLIVHNVKYTYNNFAALIWFLPCVYQHVALITFFLNFYTFPHILPIGIVHQKFISILNFQIHYRMNLYRNYLQWCHMTTLIFISLYVFNDIILLTFLKVIK